MDEPSSYRCDYTPLDRDGFPVPCESGVLPFVQVKARNAEAAAMAAHALKGCPIVNVTRLEPREPRTERQAAFELQGAFA